MYPNKSLNHQIQYPCFRKILADYEVDRAKKRGKPNISEIQDGMGIKYFTNTRGGDIKY